MSGEMVTIETLRLLLEPGEKRAEQQGAEIKEIKEQQVKTNQLLEKVVLTHSQTLNQHIKDYGEDRRKDGKRFARIFQTLEAREGYFTAAGYLKIGVGIILTAIIAAAATDWYKTKFEVKPPTEIKSKVSNEISV